MTNPQRSDRGEAGNRLNDAERLLLRDWAMWGSDMYPVRKVGRVWIVDTIHGIDFPGVHRTKGAAVCAFERFVAVLIDAAGQEAYERAIAAEAVA